MGKVYTRFHTKTAQKPYLLGRHIHIWFMQLFRRKVVGKRARDNPQRYCVFSHDVMVAIFMSPNNETAAMFVSQTSPVGVELFSYVNAFFRSNKFA